MELIRHKTTRQFRSRITVKNRFFSLAHDDETELLIQASIFDKAFAAPYRINRTPIPLQHRVESPHAVKTWRIVYGVPVKIHYHNVEAIFAQCNQQYRAMIDNLKPPHRGLFQKSKARKRPTKRRPRTKRRKINTLQRRSAA